VTLFSAAVLAIVFVVLSVRVALARVRTKLSLGDGSSLLINVGKEAEAPALLIASRSQANFAEYVPLSLLLLGLIESGGGAQWLMLAAAGVYGLVLVAEMSIS
jgi:hypothetical protein